jgi:putative transposase
MGRKRNSPSTAGAACSASAKAAMSPGEVGPPAAANATTRQRDDRVLLAHVRSAFALSNGTYGSPRMTRELQDAGLVVGRRRTARLRRDNGLRARQKRRFKRTTDCNHAWPVAPNLLDQDFTATAPDKKWGADIS